MSGIEKIEKIIKDIETEREYKHLEDVPEPKYIRHKTELDDGLKGIVEDKEIRPLGGRSLTGLVHFSMGSALWGMTPEDLRCFMEEKEIYQITKGVDGSKHSIVFDFGGLKRDLKPVFYTNLAEGLPKFVDGFGICRWDYLPIAEAAIRTTGNGVPLRKASHIVIPKPHPSLERKIEEVGVEVKRQPIKTPLWEWCGLAFKFIWRVRKESGFEGEEILPISKLPKAVTPKFVEEYNEKLYSLFPSISKEAVKKALEKERQNIPSK